MKQRWQSPKQELEGSSNHKDHRDDYQKSLRKGPANHHILVILLGFFTVCTSIVMYCHQWLPDPKPSTISDATFSEERARETLETIMSFGTRTVGSNANEVLTPNFLLQEIKSLNVPPGWKLQVQVQNPSGTFGLFFISQFQNIYANVTNILVKLSPDVTDDEDSSLPSLLLSSHFDAAIGSKGASDDGVCVAIMLELLRNFVASPVRNINLVFNFNGAEESILQASHGFVTKHPWVKSIKAFINLEAAGAGGRELLFQTGSDVLAVAYSAGASYPHASTIAQEIFQSGVIPSDTDFRIYRDFGNIAGMDFAYVANGYVYHTALDDLPAITSGCIQRFGENLFGTIVELSRNGVLASVSMEEPNSQNRHFLYDILGYYMVTIVASSANIISSLTLFVVFAMALDTKILKNSLSLVASLNAAGFITSLAVATTLSVFAPLAWYATPSLALVLFISAYGLGYIVALEKQVVLGTEERLFQGYIAWWTVFLCVTLYFSLSAMLFGVLWIVCPLVARKSFPKKSSWFLLGLVLPFMHSLQLEVTAIQFFLPLMGRAGTIVPPDFVISVILSVCTMISTSYVGCIFVLLDAKTLQKLKIGLILVLTGALIVSCVINPYSEKCTKRVLLQHTVRRHHGHRIKSDSGLWIRSLDYRGNEPLGEFLNSVEEFPGFKTQRSSEEIVFGPRVYENLPWILPVRHLVPARHTWYIPTATPAITEFDANLVLQSEKRYESSRKLHFVLTGPAVMTVFIDATSTKIKRWSIGNGTSETPEDEEDSYFMHFVTGKPPALFHFWVETSNLEPLNIAWAGTHTEITTPELEAVKKVLPSYVGPITAVSSWDVMTV